MGLFGVFVVRWIPLSLLKQWPPTRPPQATGTPGAPPLENGVQAHQPASARTGVHQKLWDDDKNEYDIKFYQRAAARFKTRSSYSRRLSATLGQVPSHGGQRHDRPPQDLHVCGIFRHKSQSWPLAQVQVSNPPASLIFLSSTCRPSFCSTILSIKSTNRPLPIHLFRLSFPVHLFPSLAPLRPPVGNP